MKPVLVINSGSSSLKYQLIAGTETRAKGLIEEIDSHEDALKTMLETLDITNLQAVGHRVVHGGTKYTQPTIINDDVEKGIEELSPLAPLHNPVNLAGIRALRTLLPDVPQVAVFDTAFHATIPTVAATYAIPTDLAEAHAIKKYGFHGTSCQYVTNRVSHQNLIICHLGNGASITAVAGNRSVDTSMGLSPLEGLVMGTRSGDIDPALPFHLIRAGLEPAEIEGILTKQSGLKGLAGASDMREVRAMNTPEARLALDLYAYRIRKYIGSYLAVVPGVQALVFTAGVGENDWRLRAEICGPLAHLGITLDEAANRAASGPDEPTGISTGPIEVLVVPTNEEAEIAAQAAAITA